MSKEIADRVQVSIPEKIFDKFLSKATIKESDINSKNIGIKNEIKNHSMFFDQECNFKLYNDVEEKVNTFIDTKIKEFLNQKKSI